MLRVYASIAGLAYVVGRTALARLEARRDSERGASVLETVVIAGGLLVLALGLIALIKVAYNKYASDIK
jgi:hypothetical protein